MDFDKNKEKPKSLEDKLLHEYWKDVGGILFKEVAVGNDSKIWPDGSKPRYIDGIRIVTEDSSQWYSKIDNINEFSELVKNNPVELIEVKGKLNRPVIGQINAGIDMFERQYPSRDIKGVIVCGEGDPALEWVCQKREIDVHIIEQR